MSKSLDIDIGQFMLDTIGMNAAAVGAYVRLMVAYRANGPMYFTPPIMRQITGLDEIELDMWGPAITRQFVVKDGLLTNEKLDFQITKHSRLRKNAAKASAAAHSKNGEDVDKGRPYMPDPGQPFFPPEAELPPPPPRRAPPPIETGPRVQSAEMHIGAPKPEPLPEDRPLPEDWQPTGAQVIQCRDEGFSLDEIANVIDSFRRYHFAAGTVSLDWSVTWEKWWDRKKPSKPKAKPRIEISNKAANAASTEE